MPCGAASDSPSGGADDILRVTIRLINTDEREALFSAQRGFATPVWIAYAADELHRL